MFLSFMVINLFVMTIIVKVVTIIEILIGNGNCKSHISSNTNSNDNGNDWRLGGKSNRETGFVFVYASRVRAEPCAMIPLWLGASKFCYPIPDPVPDGSGWTARDVPRDILRNVA